MHAAQRRFIRGKISSVYWYKRNDWPVQYMHQVNIAMKCIRQFHCFGDRPFVLTGKIHRHHNICKDCLDIGRVLKGFKNTTS